MTVTASSARLSGCEASCSPSQAQRSVTVVGARARSRSCSYAATSARRASRLSSRSSTRPHLRIVLVGLSRNEAARRFKVSIASAVRWVKLYLTTGEISPKPAGGDRRSGRIEAHRSYLLGLIHRTPDITLLEIQQRLVENCGERFAVSVLWRFFDRHGITFKKKTAHAAEQQRADVLKQRQEWFAGQLDLYPSKLVFIDESVLQRHGRSSL